MFKHRSTTLELLDGTDIPETDLFQNLKELHFINKYLGGYKITFSALKDVLYPQKNYTIIDIGSGGGDTLKEISNWCIKKKINMQLVGIDLKESCINYSVQNNPQPHIKFICDDYANALKHIEKIDVIHASLFCHHLTENQIVDLILFAQKTNATLVINDLERNFFAYHSIKILTKIFSKSYLVKNDAPLSVLRGFKKHEWQNMVEKSGVQSYSIKNKWAFRHQIIIYANA